MMYSRTAARRLSLATKSASRSRTRPNVRFQSTSTGTTSGQGATTGQLVGASVAGGATVLVGAYAYYHFSGTKDIVQSARTAHQSLISAKNTIIEKTPAPNEVITYLRNITKSYAAFIPFSSSYVDASFDALEELHHTHKEEVDEIVGKAYSDIKKTVDKGQLDVATATKIFEILKRLSSELATLAGKVGEEVLGPVLEKHPELRDSLGGGLSDIKKAVAQLKDSEAAQKAQAIYEDTSKQLSSIFSSGFSPDSVARAKDIIQAKTKEVKELSQKAAKELWAKGQKEYLEKAPDSVKQLFDESTTTAILSGSGATTAVAAIWTKVKDISSSKAGFDEKSVSELKELVQQKVQEAKAGAEKRGYSVDKLWENAESWIKEIPGGQKALDAVPDVDFKALGKVAKSKSGDAQDLLRETYSDVLKVLKDKANKAKSLAEDAKEETKDSSSKDKSKDSKDDKKDSERKSKDQKSDDTHKEKEKGGKQSKKENKDSK